MSTSKETFAEKSKSFTKAKIGRLEINFHAKPGVYSSGNNYKNSQVENIQIGRAYNPRIAMDILLEIVQRMRFCEKLMKN